MIALRTLYLPTILMFFVLSCQDEFVIGPNSCLHAVIDIIDPEKQVYFRRFFLCFLFEHGIIDVANLFAIF